MASFVDPTTATQRFLEDFASAVGLDETPNNGTIAVSGGNLLLSGDNTTDWWTGNFSAPVAHKDLSAISGLTDKPVRVYTKTDPSAITDLANQVFGLCLWVDGSNSIIWGPWQSTQIIAQRIRSGLGAGIFSTGAVAPTNWATNQIELLMYYNPASGAPRKIPEGLGLTIPRFMQCFYRIDGGAWTFAFEYEVVDDFTPTKVGLFRKRWSGGVGTAAFTELEVSSVETTGEAALVNDPSTTFDFATLPKHWAEVATDKDATVFPDASITLQNPGLRIDQDQPYSIDMPGIILAGVGLGFASPDCDIELVIDDFSLKSGTDASGIHTCGVYLQAPGTIMESSSHNGAAVAGVFRGINTFDDSARYLVCQGTAAPEEPFMVTEENIAKPGHIGQDRIRLVRAGLRSFAAFYYDDPNWVPIAVFQGTNMDQAGEEDDRVFDFLRLGIMTHIDAGPHVNDTIKAEISELIVHAGEFVPTTEPYSDSFPGSTIDKKRHIPFTNAGGGTTKFSHRELAQSGALVYTNLDQQLIDDWGYWKSQVFFPGTDCGVAWSVTAGQTIDYNGTIHTHRFGFSNEFRRNNGNDSTRSWLYVETKHYSRNYFFPPVAGQVFGTFFTLIDGVSTQIGTAVSVPAPTGDPPISFSYGVSLERSGSVWTARIGGNLIDTWNDTEGIFTAWPVNHFSRMDGYSYQAAPTFQVNSITGYGDFDPGLLEASAVDVTEISPIAGAGAAISATTGDIIIGQDGGAELLATGTFPVNEDLQVYLGLTGTTADPSCYGGQGYGRRPQSQDGTTLRFWAPLYAAGQKGALKLTVVYGGDTYVFDDVVTLVERVWRDKQFISRVSFPPWMAVGRQLRDKGRL